MGGSFAFMALSLISLSLCSSRSAISTIHSRSSFDTPCGGGSLKRSTSAHHYL